MRIRAFRSAAGGTLAVLATFTLLLPASASATVTEVGYIAKTEPATTPSCTTGPIGSVGKAMEEEKKKEEEAAKKKATEEEMKKKEAEKKKTTKTVRLARIRYDARVTGGTATISSAPTVSALAAATTTEATTESACLAISRTTGYQTKVDSIENPLVIPHNGRIVAWTIDLGKPTTSQIKYFDENEGGAPEAGISILQPEKTPKNTYKLIAQSPLVKIEPYFGLEVQLPLETTIKVKAGDVVALTVPTWAPSLALGFEKGTAWRASRQTKECSVTNTETAQTELKSKVTYSCQYLTARLAYSATLISTTP